MSSAKVNAKEGPITQQRNAKRYLDEKRIPQLFESLISALIMDCPSDHLTYLEEKLDQIKDIGVENIKWNTLISHLHPSLYPMRVRLVKDSEKDKSRTYICDEKKNTASDKVLFLAESGDEVASNTNPDLFELTNLPNVEQPE